MARATRGGASDVGYLQIRDGIVIDEADNRFSAARPVAGATAKCSQSDPYPLRVFPKICSHQDSLPSIVATIVSLYLCGWQVIPTSTVIEARGPVNYCPLGSGALHAADRACSCPIPRIGAGH